MAIIPNNTAPNIENINQYSPFAKYKKFQQAVACVPTNRVSGCALHYLRAAQTLKPRCRVCAVRTHTFFVVQTTASNFQTVSNAV